ncbi:hypothetical protein D9758_013611 [Tetrapyrgos nigripes]|uniref:Uncharacterized protein n=1 Tax=Tetrapyrgos nigripes TaxID=182062 RepID=A0A8H5C9M4_9AGAR|nr:hypothetical protein D9758_013611 [Tetrapyrgos nigripes]
MVASQPFADLGSSVEPPGIGPHEQGTHGNSRTDTTIPRPPSPVDESEHPTGTGSESTKNHNTAYSALAGLWGWFTKQVRTHRKAFFLLCLVGYVVLLDVAMLKPTAGLGTQIGFEPDSEDIPGQSQVASFLIHSSGVAVMLTFGGFVQISMILELEGVDLAQRSLSMSWYINDYPACGVDSEVAADEHIRFFVDPQLIQGDSSNMTSNDDSTFDPIYEFNPQAFCFEGTWAPDSPVFRTSSVILGSSALEPIPVVEQGLEPDTFFKNRASSSVARYPFDVYHATVHIYAYTIDTLRPVQIFISSTINPIPPDVYNRGFKVEFAQRYPQFSRVALAFSLDIKRNIQVKAYAVLVIITIALAALSLSFITFKVVFTPSLQVNRVAVLALLITALFTATQLKVTLPDVPSGSGTLIDYYVNVPALGLFVLSSLALVLSIALEISQRSDESHIQPDSEA